MPKKGPNRKGQPVKKKKGKVRSGAKSGKRLLETLISHPDLMIKVDRNGRIYD